MFIHEIPYELAERIIPIKNIADFLAGHSIYVESLTEAFVWNKE
jgi:hypothetical protein